MRYLICILLCWPVALKAQTDFKLHAHNDYKQTVPFWEAYASGAASIEVDLILQNGQLMVAHEVMSIKQGQTFEKLYLDPIRHALKMELQGRKQFQLLVDLKSEPYQTLDAVVKTLSHYHDILYDSLQQQGVTVVISGNRPKPAHYPNYPDYIVFDHQSLEDAAQLPLEKIALFSFNFRRFSHWNGKGRLTHEEAERIAQLIGKVHALGKPIRFWAAPDSKTAWKAFYDLGVDFINTDKPREADLYLRTLEKRVYQTSRPHPVYSPSFATDSQQQPISHVILLIGDGNSLAHLSAGMFANNNQLNITSLKNIGFIKTQSADDFSTDSAAGGTALASGQKANNRAIGLGPDGRHVTNLPEYLQRYHYRTGVVTTDEMVEATPAAFYAHQTDRNMRQAIAKDLLTSPLALFVGAGFADFQQAASSGKLGHKLAGFTLAQSLEELARSQADQVGYFAADRSLPPVHQGRQGFLTKAVGSALQYFAQQDHPFFLMVENAHIDVAGHWNNAPMLVEEVLDFDLAVGACIRFADEHPGTLVIVTSDHETGSLGLPHGNNATHTVELDFNTDDHSGIMVPIFAYGPHADEFRGVYENTEVFHKIVSLIARYHTVKKQ